MNSFNPVSFLDMCDVLLKLYRNSRDEGYLRAAVNRSYLAAYVCTKWWLQEEGYEYNQSAEDYKQIEKDIRDKRTDDGPGIKDKLKELRIARVSADYCYCDRIKLDEWNVKLWKNIAQSLIRKLWGAQIPKAPPFCDVCIQ